MILAITLLLFSFQQSAPDRTPKRCVVTEVVQEGLRSDCGGWQPVKGEKMFMPSAVSKSLKVGDTFYFAWKENRWVAQRDAFDETKPEPQRVALVFGPEPERIEFMDRSKAEVLYVELKAKQIKLGLGEQEAKTLAALVVALGTVQNKKRLLAPPLDDRLGWEIMRGVHLPLQDPEPVKRRRN